MAATTDIAGTRASYKAIFALDIITAFAGLVLFLLATGPTFQRLRERRLSVRDKYGSPLKTSLGTYLFVWPGLLCFTTNYILQVVNDVLKTAAPTGIDYDSDLALGGRRAGGSNNPYAYSIAAISFARTFLGIVFATVITGGIWIYSSHVLSNSATKNTAPGLRSKLWNTYIMLSIAGLGLATFGLALAARPNTTTTFGQIVHADNATRTVYLIYRVVIVATGISVTRSAIKAYSAVTRQRQNPDRPHMRRFTLVVIPLLWIRNAFIIYNAVLVYYASETSAWSRGARLATVFLLTIFTQMANAVLLGMILYGAWQLGRTVPIFQSGRRGGGRRRGDERRRRRSRRSVSRRRDESGDDGWEKRGSRKQQRRGYSFF
ncbi:hypothetical protein B0A50_06604 [Salinomyces thailandicus]|uniref:Uncharacterized protein n=1 Tax=Salinomyces thailandicus TaxID=706561 RepID=A0A4U0TSU1_9PEZI|nr:hypothetical protein B0A50_06604 [Salinomyces thailandica]